MLIIEQKFQRTSESLTFFNSIKDINRLRKEIKRLLSKGMFLKEINRFRKEISRLLIK